MLRPLPAAIGLRYARRGRRSTLASFITVVSVGGVCVGVAALIAVLSVMNGFEAELRSRLLSISAHVTVRDPGASPAELVETAERLQALVPRIQRAEPFIELQGLVSLRGQLAPVLVRGAVAAGLTPGERGMLTGQVLANRLGAVPGDELTLLFPRTDSAGSLLPVVGAFELRGNFEVGLADLDASLALATLEDVAALAGRGAASGVSLTLDDPMAAPSLAGRLRDGLGPAWEVSDWTREHSAYFRAVHLEKLMMGLILGLIVAVAAFNIVASLVMVVGEKRGDIAILRTLGMTPGGVVGVFAFQGLIIGWLGTGLGVLAGVILAHGLPDLAAWLEALFGFQVFDAEVYYITRIPSKLEGGDVLLVAVGALVATSLATWYPARRAAAVEPAEALRHD
ncbi:MAG: FtsX-like permease family protein [Steroidobacteraceae bacterium]